MDGVAGPQLRHAGLKLSDDPGELDGRKRRFRLLDIPDERCGVVRAALCRLRNQLGATAGAPGPAQEFKLGAAFVETLLLLTSSFTFGLASIALKQTAGAAWYSGWWRPSFSGSPSSAWRQ